MITKDYAAIRYLLANAAAVTGLLATGPGGNPIIVYGTIPQESVGLPAISFHRLNLSNRFGVRDGGFMVHCFAETEPEATDLSEAVNEVFRDSLADADGYALKTESDILPSVQDPSGCIHVPVTVRVITT
jgi:hypothetical protein